MDEAISSLESSDSAVVTTTLKELCERSEPLPSSLRQRLVKLTRVEQPWVVRLHLVRLIPRLEWAGGEREEIVQYLFAQAAGANRFVAAWSLDALATLAVSDLGIRPRVAFLLQEAYETGSAAVRVRARHGLRRLGRPVEGD